MSRPYPASQRQPRSANLQMPRAVPQDPHSLRSTPNYRSPVIKPQIQQTSYYHQQRAKSTSKLRISEQNSFLVESPLYNQIYQMEKNLIQKTHESYTQNPLDNSNQEIAKIEISDLKDELVRKSNRIQQLLTNSAKRMHTRSISPQAKFTQKNIGTSTVTGVRGFNLTPKKKSEQSSEIKEMLALKKQEIENLKKQNTNHSNFTSQTAQDFRAQFEAEKKKLDNLANKLQTKVISYQQSPQQPRLPSQTPPPKQQQQIFKQIRSTPQLADQIKQKISIQSPDLKWNQQKLKQEQEAEKIRSKLSHKSFEIDSIINQNDDQLSFRNSNLIKNFNENQPDQSNQIKEVQNENYNLQQTLNQVQEKSTYQQKENFILKDQLLKEKQLVTALKAEISILKQNKIHLQDQLQQQSADSSFNTSFILTPNKQISESKRRADHFKNISDSYRAQLKEQQIENEHLSSEINKLILQVSKLKQDKQTVLDKVSNIQIQNEQYQSQIDDYREQCIQAQDGYRQQEMEIKSQQRQWKFEQKSFLQQITNLKNEIDKLSVINSDLQYTNDDLLNQMQMKVREMVKSAESKFEKQFKIINLRLEEKEQSIEKLNTVIKQKLQSDLQSLMDIQDQIVASDEQAINPKQLSHLKNIQNYEQELQNIMQIKEDLEYMLQQSQEYHTNKIDELEQDIQFISKEKNQLVYQLQQMQEQNNQYVTLVSELNHKSSDKDSRIEKLQNDLKIKQDSMSDQNNQSQYLLDENQNLQVEISNIKQELFNTQLRAKEQVQELESKNYEITEQYDNLFAEVSQSTLQLPDAQKMVWNLISKQNKIETSLQHKQKQNNYQNWNSQNIESKDKDQTQSNFESTIENLTKENQQLKMDIKELQIQI